MKARLMDRAATVVLTLIAVLIIGTLVGLLGFILSQGWHKLNLDFLTSPPDIVNAGGGIGPQLFNSLYLLVLTMLIALPLGIGAGIYMAEYAPDNKITQFIRMSIEVLSSLPSIVVGLFGLLVFVNMTGWGYTLFGGALALTVFNLPLLVRVTEDALRNVPRSQKEASLALGITKWRTIVSVILPAALPGILTGAILASGRVFGEAAALLFTAGMSSPNLDFTDFSLNSTTSPLNPFRPAETLAVHIWKVNSEGLTPDARDVADGASAVLIIAVLLFNLSARWFGNWVYKKMTSGSN
ncbi:phosphate ABC transporter permease PstA [Brevibacillus sp. DP1.3A]|uniref:phosphate ABC transporter permease PstA n=1 Tax=unclassified Brevibacillus TaxID=2684853 RepID=UPI00156AE7EE|nr:phosphate ABC transporter permease PstA [Brevibacillus sp. DP1.3A]MED1917900.1 phosphate ABC transporter permease PstA [Bacillus thuringiensis]UED74624.1 phosphate ABC transporter permease PstA [Brevibacillus sp. DP1.3A]